MKRIISISLTLVMLLSCIASLTAFADSSSITVYAKDFITGENKKDYYVNHGGATAPVVLSDNGVEMTQWEWQKYSVTAPVAGIYSVSVNASVNVATPSGITVRTDKTSAYIPLSRTCEAGIVMNWVNDEGYIWLDEGVNTITVENSGDEPNHSTDGTNGYLGGYFVLNAVKLTKAPDSKFDEIKQIVLADTYTDTTVAEGVTKGFYNRYLNAVNYAQGTVQELTYKINVLTDGYYDVNLRLAVRGALQVKTFSIDGTAVATKANANGWIDPCGYDQYRFLTHQLAYNPVKLTAGEHEIKLSVFNGNALMSLYGLEFVYNNAEVTVSATNTTKSGENDTAVSGTDWYRTGQPSLPVVQGGFEMTSGSWGRYSVTAPGAGVYKVTVKAGKMHEGVVTLKVSSENGYETTVDIEETSDNWSHTITDVGYIYLNKGENIVKVTDMGPSYFIFHGVTFSKVDDSYISEVGITDVTVGAVDVTKSGEGETMVAGTDWYRAGQSSLPYVSSGYFEMTKDSWGRYSVTVPVSGVYAISAKYSSNVESANELTVSSDVGYVTSFAVNQTCTSGITPSVYSDVAYIWLNEGENILKFTNTGSSYYCLYNLTFSKADDSFISEVGVNDVTVASSNTTKSGANDTSVKGTDWDRSDKDTFPSWNGGFEMTKDSWGRYEVNALIGGVYKVTVKAGNTSGTVSTLGFETEAGSSAEVTVGTTSENWGVVMEDVGYIQLSKGKNIVKVTNKGPSYFIYWNVTFSKISDSDYENILALEAINKATDSAEIKKAMTDYAETLEIDLATDFANVLAPEYSYATLVGAYETVDAFKTAYNALVASPKVTYTDGENVRNITVSTISNVNIGDCVIAAAYRGGQLVAIDIDFVAGDTTSLTLSNYTAEEGDTFKLMVWSSLEGMTPISY